MEIFAPEYFPAFRCLAARCPDSCCKEWEVDVDSDTAEKYRALPGLLGERLRRALRFDGDAATMTIVQGRCPMWRDDGLCEIQAQLGPEGLCQVCRDYPRLRHDYGDFVELGLELSCPEAARLILNASETPMTRQTVPGGDAPGYDPETMALLRQSREQAFALLRGGDAPAQTLAVILLFAYGVQSQLDGYAPPVVTREVLLAEAHDLAGSGSMEAIFAFFRGLEILTPQWKTRLAAPPVSAPLSAQTLPLMRYFLERYWFQAVSDWDLIGRVKLGVTACLLVSALGGDFVQTAQLFSKEIENDPDNLDAILDAAHSHPAFSDGALLGLLGCGGMRFSEKSEKST